MRPTTGRPVAVHARAPHLLIAAAICVATILPYSNSFATGFALDSKALVLDDARVHDATTANVNLILRHSYWWPRGESGLYRPVTTLSYLFNFAVLRNRDRPAGYHAVNLALHVLNVLLAYAVLWRLTRRAWISAAAAGLWAVHPLSTEAVTNIVGRADLLAAASILGGFWLWLESADAGGGRRWVWLAALALVATFGVFAKETAVVIVGLVVLYAAVFPGRWRAALAGVAVLAVPLALMWHQRSIVLGAAPPTELPFVDNPIVGAGWLAGRLTALAVMGRYVWLTAWPASLSCDYSFAAIPVAGGHAAADWLAWGTVAAAGAGALMVFRRDRTGCLFAGFALVTLLPGANLLFPTGTIMAERLMYLPSLGIIVCALLAVARAGRVRRAPAAAALAVAAVAMALGARTWARNVDWTSDVSLWRAAVRVVPGSFKAHRALADALDRDDLDHAHLNEVLAQSDRAVAILDSLPPAMNDPGTYRDAAVYYMKKGDVLTATDAAAGAQAYRTAVMRLTRAASMIPAGVARLRSQSPGTGSPELGGAISEQVYGLLSTVYQRLHETDEAVAAARQALASNPLSPAAYQQSASALADARRPDDAAVALLAGYLVTSDLRLRSALLDLYARGLDQDGCAVTATPNGPALNPSCPIVRRHLCAASAEAFRANLQVDRPEAADRIRAAAIGQFGCGAEAFGRAAGR